VEGDGLVALTVSLGLFFSARLFSFFFSSAPFPFFSLVFIFFPGFRFLFLFLSFGYIGCASFHSTGKTAPQKSSGCLCRRPTMKGRKKKDRIEIELV
jgi:hypothetical protein